MVALTDILCCSSNAHAFMPLGSWHELIDKMQRLLEVWQAVTWSAQTTLPFDMLHLCHDVYLSSVRCGDNK